MLFCDPLLDLYRGQVARPPVAATHDTSSSSLRRGQEHLVVGQRVGEFVAEVIDRRFQAVVEHVSHHGHAAAHPLAAAEFRAAKLRHRAAAVVHGDQHAHRRVVAEIVTAGDVVDDVFPRGCEWLHSLDCRKVRWRHRVFRTGRARILPALSVAEPTRKWLLPRENCFASRGLLEGQCHFKITRSRVPWLPLPSAGISQRRSGILPLSVPKQRGRKRWKPGSLFYFQTATRVRSSAFRRPGATLRSDHRLKAELQTLISPRVPNSNVGGLFPEPLEHAWPRLPSGSGKGNDIFDAPAGATSILIPWEEPPTLPAIPPSRTLPPTSLSASTYKAE